MRDRKVIFLLIVIMTSVFLIVAGVAIGLLYRTAFAGQRARLVETVQSQACLLEAICRWEQAEAVRYPGEGHGPDHALMVMVEAHKRYEGFGETGEFTLARRDGPNMAFLLRHRHHDLDKPEPVPFDSELAEPMRRALSGMSGTVVGPDYRGMKVLAAHEPVEGLNWGIVAKIDLAEVRAPFVRAGVTTVCIGLMVVLAGAALFLRLGNPLVRRFAESEERLRMALSAAAMGTWRREPLLNRDTRDASLNRILGLEAVESTQSVKDFLDRVHPHDRASVDEAIQAALRERASYVAEFRIVRPDGEVRWLRDQGRGFYDRKGRSAYMTGAVVDITECKRAEEEVRRQQEFLASVLESLAHPLYVIDADDYTIKLANSAASPGPVPLRTTCHTLSHRRDTRCEGPEQTCPLEQVKKTKRPVIVEHTHHDKDGRERCVEVRALPILDREGNVSEVIEYCMDITERVEAEEEARAAQHRLLDQQRSEKERVEAELTKARERLVSQTRLATIGQISASIAHDLRNPLGTVRNAVYFLRHRIQAREPDLVEHLDIIDQEVTSADRIIGNLLEMTRAKELIRKDVDLGRIVQEMMERGPAAEGIHVRMTLAPEPFSVYADPDQLRQVLGNLLNNARQAMDGHGEIWITASRSSDRDTIIFQDNGPGIAPESRERLFQPLFSTKAKGTGLGLTISRQIIERHGGTIDLMGHGGPGAAFRIRLPRCTSTEDPGDDERTAESSAVPACGRHGLRDQAIAGQETPPCQERASSVRALSEGFQRPQ